MNMKYVLAVLTLSLTACSSVPSSREDYEKIADLVYGIHCTSDGKVRQKFVYHEEYVPPKTAGMFLDQANELRAKIFKTIDHAYYHDDFILLKAGLETDATYSSFCQHPYGRHMFCFYKGEYLDTDERQERIQADIDNELAWFVKTIVPRGAEHNWGKNKDILVANTTVKSAPREDGHVLYEITFNPEAFCHGHKIWDFISK